MSIDNRMQHLGTVYRLIEQFELISRTDLAKLSGLAPASITNLTKILIDRQFVLERAVQNSTSRGRPAVGLAVSDYHWNLLCITLSAHQIEITLCTLGGKALFSRYFPLEKADYANLDFHINAGLQEFMQSYDVHANRLFAVSVSVAGRLDREQTAITKLGATPVKYSPLPLLQRHFDCPILLNEHFKLWLLAESTIGGLINDDDVIFLQLGENINLSILLKGALLNQQSRMNVDKMSMPKFSALSDEIAENCDEIERYQLTQQVTLPQVAKLVDRYLPNQFTRTTQKINLLCEQIKAKNPQALQILQHISDNLSYVLMNLINIFSSKKIMFNSPLLQVQEELFEQITQKLKQHLLRDDLDFQLTTAQIAWNSPLIPCSAIKQGIYEGILLKEGI